MFAGPIIAREVLTAPRPLRYYATRASYALGLLIVLLTAWQALVGWTEGITLGLLARFGGIVFQYLALIQVTLMLFFAPLAAATAVAHEKDRRTFVLLLMTDLGDVEIVLGKMLASLLQILTLLLAGLPVFLLVGLLGGISMGQVIDVFVITASAGLFGGAVGTLVALWRDRTFQSLALTMLLVVLAVIAGEAAARSLSGESLLATALGPYQALLASLTPDPGRRFLVSSSTLVFAAIYLGLAALILGFGILRLRVWNPSSNEPREQREEEGEVVEQIFEVEEAAQPGTAVSPGGVVLAPAAQSVASGGSPMEGEVTTGLHVPRRTHRRVVKQQQPYRRPWANPIIWRELMTRAYGTKPLIIKGAYVLAFALGVAVYVSSISPSSGPWEGAKAFIPPLLAILSLILINAQGVTALTSERDTGALDLLLVTELSPKEFIYGKLYGVLYNAKEMVLLPVALITWMMFRGYLTPRLGAFAILDFLLLAHFSAMLGIHSAITYTNSRTAVANSLGTIFFLMLGILFCAGLIIQSDQEFGRQLLSFLMFIGAGSVALYASLGSKNPSHAIALVALLTPFWSFYCIISLLQGDFTAAFLVSLGIYGFALCAMLVPAVSDFDIALGRTSALQG